MLNNYTMINSERNIFLTPPVDPEQNGDRLDRFLTLVGAEYNLSRNRVQKLVENGCVTLAGREMEDCSRKVRTGEIFQVDIPLAEEADPIAQNIPLDIVYEDSDLLVVNKPAGMTVHPAPGASCDTLVNALLYHCQDLSGIGGVRRPGIVHRIDKDTSGLLVVAKNDFAHQKLSEQFFVHSIERTYIAFVYGVPNPLCGTIEGNIARSRFDRKKMALSVTGGKHAVTHYETTRVYRRGASCVQCHLETGRTHQIRVHLSGIGCALIGDQVYVKNHKSTIPLPAEIKTYLNTFPRQALHAGTLGFIHPRTGAQMSFSADLPSDMKELEVRLNNL